MFEFVDFTESVALYQKANIVGVVWFDVFDGVSTGVVAEVGLLRCAADDRQTARKMMNIVQRLLGWVYM